METIRDSVGRIRLRWWDGRSYDEHQLRGRMAIYYLGELIEPAYLESLIEAYRDGFRTTRGHDLDDYDGISTRLAAEEIRTALDANRLGRQDGNQAPSGADPTP